jgi:hypothetical protein
MTQIAKKITVFESQKWNLNHLTIDNLYRALRSALTYVMSKNIIVAKSFS